VLVARDADRLAEAARRCEVLGGRALAVPGDVTDGARMLHVVAEAVAAFGRVDVWVNNAGTSLWGAFEDIPLATHQQLIAVDLLGVLNGAHAVVPHFLVHGGTGVIINVVSIAGRPPSPWASSYSAAKFGVAGLTDAFRAELASHSRIKVCGVYPAFTDTPTATRSGNYTGRTLRPVPPVVSPERVAAAIVSLAGRPRRARRVGSQHVATAAYAVAPDTVGRIAARLGGWYFRSVGEPSEPADGALFGVRPAAVSGRGGWGRPQRIRARAVVAGMAVAAGVTAAVVRSAAGEPLNGNDPNRVASAPNRTETAASDASSRRGYCRRRGDRRGYLPGTRWGATG
jgi:short-subunit dehydrogenase